MTASMERATWLMRLYSFLLILYGVVFDAGLILLDKTNPQLTRLVIMTTVFSIAPGILLWLISTQMQRVKLWAFVAAAVMDVVLVIQFFMSIGLISAGIYEFVAFVSLRIPLVFLLATMFNADVKDAYANHRRDRQMVQRGFEPIMQASPIAKVIPPPPAMSLRRRS